MQSNTDLESFARRWQNVLDTTPDAAKVKSLDEAIREHVQDQDTLYFGGAWARPNAALFELSRQFWGKQPRFTLATPALANQFVVPIHGQLVRKAISAIHATVFPAPAPNPVYAEAYRQGRVDFEDWSMHTLVQRLQAAAMGLPFLPTRSLAGSDLGSELAKRDCYAQVEDPFGGGKTGVVPALHPDVTFIHGLAASVNGDTLICPPYYDNHWAAFAARRSVIVTVEKIVEPEFIRRYAHLNRLPGVVVSAVCEVPFGGHPTSVPGTVIPELGGYMDDYEFLAELQRAASRPDDLDRWIGQWITGCATHEAYFTALGSKRMNSLKERTRAHNWLQEAPTVLAGKEWPRVTRAERQAVFTARQIRQRIAVAGYRTVLAGLGISSLAAWVAVLQERENGTEVELLVENGTYGTIPCPLDPFLFNYRNIETAKSLNDISFALGVMSAGNQNRTLAVLSAAQVDRHGNLNTSRVGDLLLTGSGGANDAASTAAEVLVTVPHQTGRLVAQVEFITSPGENVQSLVTDRVIMQRDHTSTFELTDIYALPWDASSESGHKKASELPWGVDDLHANRLAPPSTDELALLRLFDPEGYFLADKSA